MKSPLSEGVHEAVPEAVYHADPAPEPSLSSSVANVLLERSARHAWIAHPRLNPDHEAVTKTIYDIGHAAHALALEGRNGVTVIEAPNYKTKAAQEARKAAYNAGSIPLLEDQWDDVQAMARVARLQLDDHEEAAGFLDPAFGRSELTLIWREGEVWCRCRPDWTPLEVKREFLLDYKTTGGSAHPDFWSRARLWEGPDFQAAFYRRGARACLGMQDPAFYFIVQENEPPYALSVIALAPAAMALADRKVEAAIRLWGQCRAENRWPGYPSQVAHVEAPPWIESRWEEREGRERHLADFGKDVFKASLDWQAPLTPGRTP